MYASGMYKYTCLGTAIDNMAVCVYVYSCVHVCACIHVEVYNYFKHFCTKALDASDTSMSMIGMWPPCLCTKSFS